MNPFLKAPMNYPNFEKNQPQPVFSKNVNAPNQNYIQEEVNVNRTDAPNQMQNQMPQVQYIVANQMTANQSDLLLLKTVLKTDPRTIVCPYCKRIGFTRTEKKFSIKSALLGLLCGIQMWIGIQVVRDKDLNCYDSNHYCQYCNSLLVQYEAI